MPEVRPGQVYEWVRYAGSGREMPIEVSDEESRCLAILQAAGEL